jgi:hypothetical protein
MTDQHDDHDDHDDHDEAGDDDAPRSGRRAVADGRRRAGGPKATTARWTRWLHVYTSMISLLVVLFFGITGLTLNHPTWSIGGGPSTRLASGTLPAGFATNGTVDFLAVSEFVRSEHGVRGSVKDYGATATEGGVSYKAPGYAADLVFDVGTGSYQLTVEEQGLLGALNDLHKGRDTASGWTWLIDVAAVFLVVVAVTGLGIQVFQRKRRRRALSVAGAFTVLSLVAIVITLR